MKKSAKKDAKKLEKEIREIRDGFRKDIRKLEKEYEERIRQVHDSLGTYEDIIKGGKISLDVIARGDIKGASEKILVPIKNEFDESVNLIKRLTKEGIGAEFEKSRPETEEVEEQAPELVSKVAEPEAVKEAVKISSQEAMKEPKIRKETPERRGSIDSLFELITRKGEVNTRDASCSLNVHKVQVEEWSKILKKHRLIDVSKEGNMMKKNL